MQPNLDSSPSIQRAPRNASPHLFVETIRLLFKRQPKDVTQLAILELITGTISDMPACTCLFNQDSQQGDENEEICLR